MVAASLVALSCAGAALLTATPVLKESLRVIRWSSAVLPEPTGPWSVGFTRFEVPGADRQTGFPVDLRYRIDRAAARNDLRSRVVRALRHAARVATTTGAALSAAQTSYPLILYFPSWFSVRTDNSVTLGNLASHGYIVAAIDDIVHHPPATGSDADAQHAATDTSSEAALARSLVGVERRTTLEALAGSAVIDALAASTVWGPHLDRTRVAALGFSFGGAAAAEMSRSDPRIRAVVNLDGSLYGEAARLGVDTAYLVLFTGSLFPTPAELVQPDLAARFEAILTKGDVERQFRDAGRPDHWTYWIKGAEHLDLSDNLLKPSASERIADPERLWREINTVLVVFFDAALRGGPTTLLDTHPASSFFETLAEAKVSAIAEDQARQ